MVGTSYNTFRTSAIADRLSCEEGNPSGFCIILTTLISTRELERSAKKDAEIKEKEMEEVRNQD